MEWIEGIKAHSDPDDDVRLYYDLYDHSLLVSVLYVLIAGKQSAC